MNGWKPYKLNELGKVSRGKSKHRPRNEPSLFGGPYPFVQTGDIKAANMYVTNFSQTYSEKGLKQSKLWNKGTLCITIAANIAETAILGIDACFPDSIIGFIPDNDKADVRFIKYHFDILKLFLQSISQGTTQDNLSQEKLLKFDFTVPIDVNHQKLIASVVGTYDELVEINNHRIKLLEETIRELYKEWFVRMRFPGYKKAKFEKGLPQGWEIIPLSKIIKLVSGYAFKSEEFTDLVTSRVTVRMGNFQESGGLQFEDNTKYLKDDVLVKDKFIVNQGEILIVLSDVTRDGRIIGNVGLVPASNSNEKYIINQRVSKIVVADKLKYWLYAYLSSQDFKNYCLTRADSATVLNLSNDHLYKHSILLPKEDLIVTFTETCLPIIKQIEILTQQNIHLRQIRDRLLPRLISGKLEVKVEKTKKEKATV